MKKLSKSRVIDIILIAFIVVMIFIPSIRMPIMSTLQRVLLHTGIFNADTDSKENSQEFTYQLLLKDINEKPIETANLKGKPIFINVWATWCPPCMAEMPEIAKLYEEVSNEIEFMMLSVDKNRLKAKAWVEESDFPVPIYFIERLSSELEYEAIPTTWVIDRKGKIVYQRSGMAQYNTSDFKEFLRSL